MAVFRKQGRHRRFDALRPGRTVDHPGRHAPDGHIAAESQQRGRQPDVEHRDALAAFAGGGAFHDLALPAKLFDLIVSGREAVLLCRGEQSERRISGFRRPGPATPGQRLVESGVEPAHRVADVAVADLAVEDLGLEQRLQLGRRLWPPPTAQVARQCKNYQRAEDQ